MSDILKPEVYCPEERPIGGGDPGAMVPIWYCLGSYLQGRPACMHLEEATVRIAEDYCEVKCKPRSEMEERGERSKAEE